MANSWRVVIDIPEALQFSAYVGENENFRVTENEAATSKVEAYWQKWWEAIPIANEKFVRQFQEHIKSEGSRQQDLSTLETSFQNFGWFPPNFENLTDQPLLQALFLKHWPRFTQIADIEKMEMVRSSEKLLLKLNVAQLVQELTQNKGKKESNAFNLRIDFVRWPKEYSRQVSESHLVLSSFYLQFGSGRI